MLGQSWVRRFNSSLIGKSLHLLSRSDRTKLFSVSAFQVILSFLDLIGIALIGLLGALAVNGVQSKQPGNRVTWVLNVLGLESQGLQYQVSILGILATFTLISKTILSVFVTRKSLFFLSSRGALIAGNFVSRILAQPLLRVQEKTSQETVFAITTGVNAVMLGILGTTLSLVSDLGLLIVMGGGLFVVDPVLAFSTIIFFVAIAFLLNKTLHSRARALGVQEAELTIRSSQLIYEVLESYREAVVRNRRSFYSSEISKNRINAANISSQVSFLPNISKYVIETMVIAGALLISAFQFMTQDATRAVATLSIFLAAVSRIAPAILRIQQGYMTIKGTYGAASRTLDYLDALEGVTPIQGEGERLDQAHNGFQGKILIEGLHFKYPGASDSAVKEINLSISAGSTVAIVGPSGAGKTTLTDLILGVLETDIGLITISGLTPIEAIRKWPGAIGYVPQDIVITNSDIKTNVAFGYHPDEISDSEVWRALKIAQLDEFVKSLPLKLSSPVGERGSLVSGGQRQRLGIARAMITRPKLLVLDEATSSLDGKTELDFANSLSELRGDITTIIIAHRLSTVRDADLVLYLENGRIISQGNFEQVRSEVPDFDHQAKLMGI